MSLVTFSKAKSEQVFLIFSKGFESGPGIHRDGQGSPWMIDAQNRLRKITDPHEQRKGTWFLNHESRELAKNSIPSWKKAVTKRRDDALMDPQDAATRLAYYEELRPQ